MALDERCISFASRLQVVSTEMTPEPKVQSLLKQTTKYSPEMTSPRISTNVCKKGPGRPKLLNANVLEVVQRLFPRRITYRSQVAVFRATNVYRALRTIVGEGDADQVDTPKAITRWPWLLRANKEQWTVLSALYELYAVTDVRDFVFMADWLEEIHRNDGLNAKRAIWIVRRAIRWVKNVPGVT